MIGLDVSNVNGSVDFAAVAAEGHEFVFLKASEGRSFVDPLFKRNVLEARANKLKVGAYHFARPDHNGAHEEAQNFLAVIKGKKLDLRPVLDFETAGHFGPSAHVDWVRTWLMVVEQAVGCKPTVYTYPYFWQQICGDSQEFTDHPLWLASYGANDAARNAVSPVGGWSSIACHQYTSRGKSEGVVGWVDMNYADSLDPLLITRTWPKPLPAWWWEWAKWRIQGGTRPGTAPTLIPDWAWDRLKVFLAARKK